MLEFIIFVPLLLIGLSAYLFHVNTTPPLDREEPILKIKYEEVSLKTSDNVKIKGWFIPAKKVKKRPVIIVCHGLGTNRFDLIGLSLYLHEAGYNVFTFDFRGHGFSGGHRTSLGHKEQLDLISAVNYVYERKDVDNNNIGVFGLSMGAAVTVLTAAREPKIKAISVDSAYTSLWTQSAREIKTGYNLPSFPILNICSIIYKLLFSVNMKKVAPLNVVDKISPRPILFIAGELDKRITVDDAKTLYDKAGDPKKLVVIEGAEHGEGLNVGQGEYQKSILDFFNTYLIY